MTHGGANVADYCETYPDTGVALIFVLRRFAAVTVSLFIKRTIKLLLCVKFGTINIHID